MTKPQSSAHVHKMIAKVATEMAHQVYADLMTRDDWYRDWRELNPGHNSKHLEERWVSAHWGQFIDGARATLASMLSGPYDSALLEPIAEALILDATLVRGRLSPKAVLASGKPN